MSLGSKPALFALLALGGCATCREHPVGCMVASGIIATGIAISLNQPEHRAPAIVYRCVPSYRGCTPP